MNKKQLLIVVPARAGSKRIKGKNVRFFFGKELIRWTLDSILKIDFEADVVISSDDQNVLLMAKDYPHFSFLERSKDLASDTATSADVVMDAINKVGTGYHYVLLLQPTSPLRTAIHLKEAFDALIKSHAKRLVSVKRLADNVTHCGLIDESGTFSFLLDVLPRDLSGSDVMVLNGALYFCRLDEFVKTKAFLAPGTQFFVMNEMDSVDIDTEEDWKRAEMYFRQLGSQKMD